MASETLLLRIEVEGADTAAAKVERLETGVGRTSTRAKEAEKSVGRFSKGLRALASGFAFAAGTAGIAGFGLGVAEIIKNTEQFQDVQRQLGVALKNQGVNVKEGTKRLTEYADALSIKGGFTAPENISGLTTFVRVTGSVTKAMQLETLATNIARGTHKSFEASTRAVMMAESGRLTGLTRLGIILPKTATATQGLAILQKRYAGATESYSKTAAGATQNFLHELENLGEKIGQKLLPPLTAVFRELTRLADQFEKNEGLGGKVRGVVVELGNALKTTWNVIKYLAPAIATLTAAWVLWNAAMLLTTVYARAIAAFELISVVVALIPEITSLRDAWVLLDMAMDANPVGVVVTALAAVVAGLVEAYTHVKWFRNAVNAVFSWIKGHWPLLAGILFGPFGLAAAWVIQHWHGVLNFFKSVPGAIAGFFKGLGGQISSIFQTVVNGIISAINWVVRQINGVINSVNSVSGSIPIVGGSLHVGTISQVGKLGGGGGAKTGTAGLPPIIPAHKALGGPVHGFGHLDNIPIWSRPGEYVATDRMVKDVGVPAMEAWRHGGQPPGGGAGGQVLEATILLHMDGKQVGYALARQGLQQKALR